MRISPLSIAGLAGLAGLLAAFAPPPGSAPQSAPAAAAKSAAAPAPAAASPATPGAAVLQIFGERCATPKCHAGEKPKMHMDLSTPAGVKAALINIDAEEQASLKRVLPGNPEESYLFLKITKHRRDDHRIKWKQMPPGPDPNLDDRQIALIELWIKGGAALE